MNSVVTSSYRNGWCPGPRAHRLFEGGIFVEQEGSTELLQGFWRLSFRLRNLFRLEPGATCANFRPVDQGFGAAGSGALGEPAQDEG